MAPKNRPVELFARGDDINTIVIVERPPVDALVIVGVGWFVSDRIIEPRLNRLTVDGHEVDETMMNSLEPRELSGLLCGLAVLSVGLIGLAWSAWPANSPWRSIDGDLVGRDSPIMKSIVSLIFLLFLIPGVVHGFVARTIKSHRDIVLGMTTEYYDPDGTPIFREMFEHLEKEGLVVENPKGWQVSVSHRSLRSLE